MVAKILPITIAPSDNTTFANIFNPKIENCLLSKRFVDSRANEDIVVRDPQNPTATRRKYFVSRFQTTDNIENIPNTKLPNTFTVKIFSGNASVVLYFQLPRRNYVNSIILMLNLN